MPHYEVLYFHLFLLVLVSDLLVNAADAVLKLVLVKVLGRVQITGGKRLRVYCGLLGYGLVADSLVGDCLLVL